MQMLMLDSVAQSLALVWYEDIVEVEALFCAPHPCTCAVFYYVAQADLKLSSLLTSPTIFVSL